MKRRQTYRVFADILPRMSIDLPLGLIEARKLMLHKLSDAYAIRLLEPNARKADRAEGAFRRSAVWL